MIDRKRKSSSYEAFNSVEYKHELNKRRDSYHISLFLPFFLNSQEVYYQCSLNLKASMNLSAVKRLLQTFE